MQEMLGLAIFMSGGAFSDVVACFKEAFHRYNTSATRAPAEAVRYATRSMMLLAEYCRACGQYAEANYAFMKAHFQVRPVQP
jgi:ER-Golgi trafficking TRAPP I complex 85 kDa subunit